MKKKIAIVAICFLVILIILFVPAWYLVNYSLCPNPNRGRNLQSSLCYMRKTYPQIRPWLDSMEVHHCWRDTMIVNNEGIKLHAVYAEASHPTSKTAVIVHGYTDNAVRMYMIAYLYNKNLGYNVLLPDLHAHGKSGGKYVQMGWKDRLDVLRWIKIANRLFGGHTQMALHGISMGAATTMNVSGERTPDCLKCFVEDCGFTSAFDEFKYKLKEEFGLSPFPYLYLADWINQGLNGWSFYEDSPLRAVRKCVKPMLFIHGGNDQYVPTSMVYRLYAAKPAPKYLWVQKGVAHASMYLDYPKAYTSKVKSFVSKYIHE